MGEMQKLLGSKNGGKIMLGYRKSCTEQPHHEIAGDLQIIGEPESDQIGQCSADEMLRIDGRLPWMKSPGGVYSFG